MHHGGVPESIKVDAMILNRLSNMNQIVLVGNAADLGEGLLHERIEIGREDNLEPLVFHKMGKLPVAKRRVQVAELPMKYGEPVVAGFILLEVRVKVPPTRLLGLDGVAVRLLDHFIDDVFRGFSSRLDGNPRPKEKNWTRSTIVQYVHELRNSGPHNGLGRTARIRK